MTGRTETLFIDPLRMPEPWQAFTISVPAFPLPPERAAHLRLFVASLFSTLIAEHKLEPATWIEMSQVHHDDGAAMIAANARQWKPDMGLGVDPDREPPRMWTKSDFLDREWGEDLPNFMLTVSHIGNPRAARDAADTMLGRGVVLHALLDHPVDTFHQQASRLLLPRIKDPAFRCYPFYVPLLRAAAVASMRSEDLAQYLSCTAVYLRECFEDKHLLLLSRIPLFDKLRQIPFVRIQSLAPELTQ